MKIFRLIRSRPASAVYNMAMDERVFSRYLLDGIPAFRTYRWQAPCFTCGAGQKPENILNLSRCARDGIEVVKRMTGGGVLFHCDEIAYSFVCSKNDVGELQKDLVSYKQVCAFLIRFYESLGLEARFACDAYDFSQFNAPHVLCSASHEKYDVVIRGKKIGGNAQKRSRRSIFQHGSVSCASNWQGMRHYLKIFSEDIILRNTTLSEELNTVPNKDSIEDKLIEAFAHVFNVDFIEKKEASYETSLA